MRIVLLTGAGASHSLGLPLMGDLFTAKDIPHGGSVHNALMASAIRWRDTESPTQTMDFERILTFIGTIAELEPGDVMSFPFTGNPDGGAFRWGASKDQ